MKRIKQTLSNERQITVNRDQEEELQKKPQLCAYCKLFSKSKVQTKH